MKRIAILVACAALLNACGGSDQAEPQATASASASTSAPAAAANAATSDVQALSALNATPASVSQDPAATPVSESGSLWFIELAGAPEAEGTSRSTVRAEKEAFRRAARAAGATYKERRSFDVLFNGFSAVATPSERAKLAKLPGFKAMYPVEVLRVPRPEVGGGSAPDLINAIQMTGAKIAQQSGYTGNGVKVGVIDTGIDIDHPDLGGSGTPGGTPFPTARIVHGYDFVGDDFNADSNPVPVPDANPDDCNGHGTHVAGIVGARGTVTGVAPGVTFGAYRVFGCEGSTTSDIMLDAMERAYVDRMDVINMSIGAARQWPQYPTAVAASRLVKKGIVVVASIGNNGPGGNPADGLYAAGAPGVGELVIGVASFDNSQITQFAFKVDNTLYGYNQATGAPAAPKSGELPVTKTGTPTTVDDACAPLPAGSLMGSAVLIRRGTCSFYQKSMNAQQAGAAAVVLYNNVAGPLNPTVAGTPPITIPVVAITAAQGVTLDARIAAGGAKLVWTDQFASSPLATGGLISGFSSFGLAADLSIKPNIGAPGGFIFSTYPLELGRYATISGTSMSSPHVAGAAALVLQAKPRTKARDMKGLLQNWAVPALWSGNPALGFLDHVHRQGAGMVNIPASINAMTSVEPSELALGESEGGPFTQTLKIDNDGRGPVTYDITHVPALATGPNTFVQQGLQVFNAPASVLFTATSITVPKRGSAKVGVTITPHADLPDKSIYTGYLVFTPRDGGSAMRVPYAGFKGDYQSIQAVTPTPAGLPQIARVNDDGSVLLLPAGGTFTMAPDDIAYVALHLDHQVEFVELEAFNAVTGQFVGNISHDDWVARNATPTGFFLFTWDGTVYQDRGPNRFRPVPNGQYRVSVTVKKALGQDINPAHFERIVVPGVITIARL
ncbi:MAG: S8 family serine peptidase [Burkholderiaceae bacterium]|nr:S8 family serine peptidase [Burkholderiaceae bacterium]